LLKYMRIKNLALYLSLCCTLLYACQNKSTKTKAPLFIPNITVDSSFIVMIDAGHGGPDSGEIADSAKVDPKKKLYEKALNLKLALLIANLNKDTSIKIMYTRKTDTLITLKDRVIISKGLRPNLFLSIHANDAYPDTLRRGLELYTVDKNNPHYAASNYFGNNLMKQLATIKDYPILGWKTKKERLFVLRNACYPALLLEMGYMSNRLDFSLLLEPKNQVDIGYKILAAIKDYKKNMSPTLRYSCTNFNYNFSWDTTRTFAETHSLSNFAVPVINTVEYNNLLLSEINPLRIKKISQHIASAAEIKQYGPIANDGIIDFETINPDSSFLFANQLEKIMYWAYKINKDSGLINY
jgi:N-acetylmuramoyl-L-alanine amidase